MPKLACTVAAIALLLSVWVGAAEAATYRIKPVARSGDLVAFSLGQIPRGKVRTARVTDGRRSRRVSVGLVRRAIRARGLLRVAPVTRAASRAQRARSRLVVVVARSAAATNSFYVSTTGSDAAAGTQDAPWRTVARAATMAGSGSTVTIMAGSYAEDVNLSVSGASASPITFQRNGTDTVTIRSLNVAASNIVVSGLVVSGATGHCVTIQPALTNITLQGARINNCGRDGVRFVRSTTQTYTKTVTIKDNYISAVGRTDSYGNGLSIYADDVTVQGNDITGTPNDAVNMWGDRHTYRQNTIHDISNTNGHHNDAFQTWTGLNDGAEGKAVTNLVIEQNVIRNITGSNAHVIMAEGPAHSNWSIRNNLMQAIGDQAFMFGKDGNGTQGITNVLIYNNTFVSAGANNTIEFNLTTSAKLVNNIFYNCRGWGGGVAYYKGSSATLTADYNLAGGTSKILAEAHAKYGDPKFVNPASDFRLQSTSPAIDAGDNGTIISPLRTVDLILNVNQGVVDIGAFEYQG